MKKKIIAIMVIFAFILLIYTNASYGFIKRDYDSNILVIGWTQATTDEILSDLQEKMGYSGSSLTAEMKLRTTATITYINDNGKYQITFRR